MRISFLGLCSPVSIVRVLNLRPRYRTCAPNRSSQIVFIEHPLQRRKEPAFAFQTSFPPEMTQSFTDPGDVVLTGQNPFMMLFSGDGPPSSIVSFWRVHFSPAGVGHALYVRSEITGGAPRIYADNVPLARYIQSEIYAHNAR